MAKTVTVAFNSVRDIDFDVMVKGEIRHVIIHGTGSALKGVKNAILPELGCGLTAVDEDLWNAVVAKYGKSKVFKNGLIKFTTKAEEVKEIKAEVTAEANGDEPVNPEKPKKKRK